MPQPDSVSGGELPGVKELEQMLSQFCLPCVPGETLQETMAAILNHDLYARDLTPILLRNPAYSQWVLRLDLLQTRIKEWIAESAAEKKETAIPYRLILERIFTLLGKQASRNLIATIRLNRLLGTLPRKPGDRYAALPKETLKHAIAAEEYTQARDHAYTEYDFLGGLHYDFLLAALVRAKASKESQNFLVQQWGESLKVAQLAYEIGADLEAFELNRFVFSSALACGLGRILMVALFPKERGEASYDGYLKSLEKRKYGRYVAHELREGKHFGIRPGELASMFVKSMRFLAPASRAIRDYQNPSRLKGWDAKSHFLANILCVAHASALGQPFDTRHAQALAALKLTPAKLAEIRARIALKEQARNG